MCIIDNFCIINNVHFITLYNIPYCKMGNPVLLYSQKGWYQWTGKNLPGSVKGSHAATYMWISTNQKKQFQLTQDPQNQNQKNKERIQLPTNRMKGIGQISDKTSLRRKGRIEEPTVSFGRFDWEDRKSGRSEDNEERKQKNLLRTTKCDKIKKEGANRTKLFHRKRTCTAGYSQTRAIE